jgi:predicted permease
MNYWTILQASLPIYLVIATGLLLRRINLFPKELDAGLMRLVINVLYPCFILDKILGNTALDKLSTVSSAAASGFILVLLGFGLSYLAALAVGMRRSDGLRTFSLATGIQNYGFIPIPIIAILFEGKATMGVLLMHSLGVELALWTFGVAILTGLSKAPWRHLFNGPIIAILLGLLINKTGAYPHIPESANTSIAMLGSCSIPLSLLLIGAAISDLISGSNWLKPYRRPIAACIVRLAILPVAFIAFAKCMPIGLELKRVLAVQAAMPCALMPIVLARHYGGHVTTAVQVILATSLVSIFTIPAVIGIAMRVLGLE